MQPINLNQSITAHCLLSLEDSSNRHITGLYRSVQNQPKTYRGGDRRYLREDFEDAYQQASIDLFNKSKLKNFLEQLETEGLSITLDNADVIAIKLVQLFSTIVRRRCIDQWRKSTFPTA